MSPIPRISLIMSPVLSRTRFSISRAYSPVSALIRTTLSLFMISRVFRAAAQTRGEPPKVVAWLPGARARATSSLSMIAPMGSPAARALAEVMMSGLSPKCSWAQNRPVLPIPVWTSSITKSSPFSAHSS